MSLILYKANEQWLSLPRLRDADTGALKTTAVVTATLYDKVGAPVSNLTALPLVYDATKSAYKVKVSHLFNPPVGTGYTLTVTATQDGDTYSRTFATEVRASWTNV